MESRRLHWRVTNNPSTNRSQARAQQQNYSKKQRRRDRQGKDFQAMQEGKRSGTSSRRRAWNHRDVTRRTRPEGLRRGRNQGENHWSPGGGRGRIGEEDAEVTPKKSGDYLKRFSDRGSYKEVESKQARRQQDAASFTHPQELGVR